MRTPDWGMEGSDEPFEAQLERLKARLPITIHEPHDDLGPLLLNCRALTTLRVALGAPCGVSS